MTDDAFDHSKIEEFIAWRAEMPYTFAMEFARFLYEEASLRRAQRPPQPEAGSPALQGGEQSPTARNRPSERPLTGTARPRSVGTGQRRSH